MESHWCVFSCVISDLLKGTVTSGLKVNYRGASEGIRLEVPVITQVRDHGGFKQWSRGGDDWIWGEF